MTRIQQHEKAIRILDLIAKAESRIARCKENITEYQKWCFYELADRNKIYLEQHQNAIQRLENSYNNLITSLN